jgi:O-antigen/teichoic acid export membrane protein
MTRPSDSPAASGGFLFNVNLVFVATVAASGLGFVTAVLLARALGPEGRGVTALYQAAVSLGFAFLSLGIATAVVYYVGRRDISGRHAMEAGLSITLIAAALTAVGVAIAALAFNDKLADEHVPYWLTLVAIPALVQFRAAEATLRAQGRFGAMNLLEVSLPLSILACLGAVELVDGLTIHRAVVAWSLAFLPPVVIGYALLGPSQWPRGLAGRDLLWQAARFGMQGQLSNLIQLLNYRLDSYLVLLLVNAGGVGLYAVGVSLSEGMWLIANSVSVVLLTNLTAGDDQNAARMTPIVCRNTLLVTAAGSLVAAALSPFAIPTIFGHAFDDAVLPFLWLLPGTVALAGTKILAAFVFSRGRPLINAQIAFVTLVVTIVADLLLIPPFEVAGAAAASSLAYGCSLGLSAIAYRRLSGGSIADALLPRFSDTPYYVDGMHSLLGRLRRSEARP